jgi:pimeloyl-ACP methyl ester carboxylesterase
MALAAKNEVRIRYRRSGKGTPVLVLHGWGASIEAMRILFEDLAQSHDAVVIDFPGHGQSPAPPEPWTVSDFRDLVVLLMDRLEIPRAHVVAHSFGCRVAIKLAAEHPKRVGRMVLTGAAGLPPERTAGQKFRLGLAKTGKQVKGILGDGGVAKWLESQWIHYIASEDYAKASGPMRATVVNVVGEDLSGYLPRIQAPTLLLWGDKDRETPLSSGERMAALIPGAQMVVLEGGGHFAYAEQFAKFRLHMQKFLGAE